MHAADDDSVPVPQDAFRFPSGSLNWRTPFLFSLIGLGGLYGLLVLVGRLSPSLLGRPESSAVEPLELPLLVQLASAFAGLAALVLVLTRAVREVDKRPYVAIAPVLAVFAALVHAGLRVDLSQLGMSSALVAFGTLAVALLGGALIVRDEERLRWLGWGLVLAPCAWLLIVLKIVKGDAPFEPSERAYLAGLFVSTLLMGGAGVAARKLRAELLREAAPEPSFPAPRAGREDLSEAVTIVAPAFRRPVSRDTARLTMRGSTRRPGVFRAGRARTAAMLVAVAVATYLTVGGLRRGANESTAGVLPASMAPSGPPVVEQLSGARKSLDQGLSVGPARRDHGGRGDKRASKSAARTESSYAAAGAANFGSRSDARASNHRSAPPAKQARPTRSAPAAAPAKTGLPAWGSEALREFDSPKSAGKPTKASPSKAFQESAPLAPPPAAAPTQYKTTFAKPVEKPKPLEALQAPKPVEPPKPVKPMTMDQVLDRVEQSAQAQRKKSGAKQGKVDADLEALINGSMKKKSK